MADIEARGYKVRGRVTGYEGNTSHIRTSIRDYVHKVFPSRIFSLYRYTYPTLSLTLSLYFSFCFSLSISFLLSYPPSHHIIHNIYIYIIYMYSNSRLIYKCTLWGKHTGSMLFPSPMCVFVLGPAGHCSRQFRLGQTV